MDSGSSTSAGGASFGTAVTNVQITGSITAQPSVTLGANSGAGQNNGTLKIVGASDITMQAGATLTIDSVNDTGTKGIIKTGGGTSIISGGANVNQTQKNGMIRVDGPTDVLNIAMQYNLASQQRFMKSGAGTLIFSAGTITLEGYNHYINGGVLEIGGSATLTANATAEIRTAYGAVLRYNSSSTTSTIARPIVGCGGVTLSAGALALSGANTFSGPLTLEGGKLATPMMNNTNAAGSLGQSTLPIVLGKTGGSTGTVEYSSSTTNCTRSFTLAVGGAGAFQVDTPSTILTITGAVSGGGGLTKSGAGTLILSGTNTYTGDTRVDAGTLRLDSASLCSTSSVYVATGAILNLNFTGTNTIYSLYLGGVQQSAGIYGLNYLGGATFFSGTGALNVINGPDATVFIIE